MQVFVRLVILVLIVLIKLISNVNSCLMLGWF